MKTTIKKPATTKEIRFNFANMDKDLQGRVVRYLVQKHAVNASFNSSSHFHVSDLESYLGYRAWESAMQYDSTKNPNFEAYLKNRLNQYTLNFYKSNTNINVTAVQAKGLVYDYVTGEKITVEEAKLRGIDISLCDKVYETEHNVANFSEFEVESESGDISGFEDSYVSPSAKNVESTVETKSLMDEIYSRLTDVQIAIVELSAGILTSLSADQLATAKAILAEQHATKSSGEVYFSARDIATILGIHYNSVTNHLKKVNAIAREVRGY